MPLVTIRKKPSDVVVIDQDYGGHLCGHCFACGASGWLDGLGYPSRVKKPPGAHLQHKKWCPMNRRLRNDGSLRK